MSHYRPLCSQSSLYFSEVQRKSRETKATDSSILCCSLRGPTQFRGSQGHSLCLPFFLSQDNFCFYLYCFYSIRSFISYSYTDSPHQKQKSRQIAPSDHWHLLLRAGHLITHPFPRVWDPECSCLRFRWVSASLSSFCHLLVVILESLDTSGFSLPLASSLLQPLRTPLRTPELLWQSLEHIYVYDSSSLLHTHNFTFYLSFMVQFNIQDHPTPPPPPSCHNQKSSFQKQWHFKSDRTKTRLPNPASVSNPSSYQ